MDTRDRSGKESSTRKVEGREEGKERRRREEGRKKKEGGGKKRGRGRKVPGKRIIGEVNTKAKHTRIGTGNGVKVIRGREEQSARKNTNPAFHG